MPKKKSDSSSAGKPRKAAASKRTAKDSVLEQADLFENQPDASAPKKAAAPSPRKISKPRIKAATSTTSSPRKPPSVPTTANTKQYIQKIPYASVLIVGYVALVLVWDTLVTVGDSRTVNWAVFQWRPPHLEALLAGLSAPNFLVGWMSWSILSKVDLFKLLFWLVIPVGLCLWRMDWDYFTKRRIKPVDWQFLLGMCGLALVAIISVKFIPSLARLYHGSGASTLSGELAYFVRQMLWVLSWLVGWEFMHRYFLLRRVTADFPRFGWLLVPLAEGAYHLVKPWPEMLAMVAFSVIMTQYVMRRKNLVIPFLAHMAVEVLLIVGMMIW